MPFGTGLDDAQKERLAILAGECAEVIEIITKIERHGYENYHPSNRRVTNRQLLQKELGHLLNAFDLMLSSEDVDILAIHGERERKSKEIRQWLRFQPTGE